jgi:predicted DNA-binding transcriptional regulator AlpA
VSTDDDLQLIRKRDLAKLLGINTWTVDEWRRRGRLPEPLVLSPQVVAWRRTDIDGWLRKCESKPALTRKPNAKPPR